jgi:hypothetical protein
MARSSITILPRRSPSLSYAVGWGTPTTPLGSFNAGEARSNAITTGTWQVNYRFQHQRRDRFREVFDPNLSDAAADELTALYIDEYLAVCELYSHVKPAQVRPGEPYRRQP